MTGKTAKKRYRFRPLLWINYLFIVLLLLTNLTPYIAPDIFWPMTLLALVTPILIIINILFFLLWAVSLKIYLLYPLLALILSYSMILNHFQLGNTSEVNNDTKAIKLLTFNARNLSNNNNYRGDKLIRAQIAEFVKEQSADIVCFQEFQTYPTKGVNSVKDYQNILGLKHIHSIQYLKDNTHEFIDLLVLYTRYPIINSYDFYMDDKTYGFYVDLNIDGVTTRVFNLHLESNHFNKSDYQIFSKSENSLDVDNRSRMMALLQKLKKYSIKRSHQAGMISKAIEDSPYPVIVAGDFNDTPASYTYQRISRHLSDAFLIKGSGYSNTYNGNLPPMRIDYTLFSDGFLVDDYQVLKPDLSDHFPISVTFNIKR